MDAGGQPRPYVAALDIDSGDALSWNPSPNDVVYVLAASSASLFVGGSFTAIRARPQSGLAEIHDAVTGVVPARTPTPSFLNVRHAPEPFSTQTMFSFQLARTATVSLCIYDAMGREIRTLLAEEIKGPGLHQVSFDARELPSGIYFMQLNTEGISVTDKLVLLR